MLHNMTLETFNSLDELPQFVATMFAYIQRPLSKTSIIRLARQCLGAGQRNPVTVYRLIASDTVEERVLELHKEKKQIAEDMLEGTGAAALSPARLMGLFGTKGA